MIVSNITVSGYRFKVVEVEPAWFFYLPAIFIVALTITIILARPS